MLLLSSPYSEYSSIAFPPAPEWTLVFRESRLAGAWPAGRWRANPSESLAQQFAILDELFTLYARAAAS